MERRLAAILSADVVGYSRLMGEDEAGTLDAFKTERCVMSRYDILQGPPFAYKIVAETGHKRRHG